MNYVSPLEGETMAQLNYSGLRLYRTAAVSVMFLPAPLILATDERITSGHVIGLWTGLLYEIGPVGRWAFVIFISAALVFAIVRSIAVALGDRVALRATSFGLFYRTLTSQHNVRWDKVLSVDRRAQRIKGRTYYWMNIRVAEGISEKNWHIATSVLDADDLKIDAWLAEARRLQIGQAPVPVKETKAVSGQFGRRRPFITG